MYIAKSTASSLPYRLTRLLAAVRTWLERNVFVSGGDALEAATVGSVVRVFGVDTLQETTLFLAPDAWSGTTSGVVAADSPIGAALMGGRASEIRTWESPSGPQRLQIVAVDGRLPLRVRELADEQQVVSRMLPSPNRKASGRRPFATLLPASA
jgi:hypothetical protein